MKQLFGKEFFGKKFAKIIIICENETTFWEKVHKNYNNL